MSEFVKSHFNLFQQLIKRSVDKKKKALKKKKRHVQRHFCIKNYQTASLEDLIKCQPSKFKVHHVYLFEEGKQKPIDVTYAFLRLWAMFEFDQFAVPNIKHSLCHQSTSIGMYDFPMVDDWFLVISYSYKHGDSWKIIYDKNQEFLYPPYERCDKRIPEFKPFSDQVMEASLIFHSPQNQQIVSEELTQEIINLNIAVAKNEFVAIDVTDVISECSGPGALFYRDTDLVLMNQLVAKWIKQVWGIPQLVLKITMSDSREEFF